MKGREDGGLSLLVDIEGKVPLSMYFSVVA